jgi:hypothetical protein
LISQLLSDAREWAVLSGFVALEMRGLEVREGVCSTKRDRPNVVNTRGSALTAQVAAVAFGP